VSSCGNRFWRGDSPQKFFPIDTHVNEGLALVDRPKRQKLRERWDPVHNEAWVRGIGAYQLSKSVRCCTPAARDPLILSVSRVKENVKQGFAGASDS
jgi:hypothetical protein